MSKAVFTIVKNEKEYLPIWYKYYSKFFNQSDIYILDHDTTDGSTDGYKNVIKFSHKYSFDSPFFISKVSGLQKNLLEKYKIVLFSEVDEIVVPLKNSFEAHLKDYPCVKCTGYGIYHDRKKEPPINWTKPLLKQRTLWFHEERYNKPLLSKIPLSWTRGFHKASGIKIKDAELLLLHIKWIDYDFLKERHLKRIQWPRNLKDARLKRSFKTWQWIDKNFDKWYRKSTLRRGKNLSEIPREIRDVI